jgi:hypothetical protein
MIDENVLGLVESSGRIAFVPNSSLLWVIALSETTVTELCLK